MPSVNRIAEFHDDMKAWRRDLHAHPELAFAERRTAATVARLLEGFGIAVETGIAETGVVGVLRAGTSDRAIALRADMDALPLDERNGFDHRSTEPGRMHACGHDGHTAMLLGAARYLAETRNFDGTVVLVFQPAEEGGGGGRVMVEDERLFERFPVEAAFGLHNWPGMPVGTMAMRAGPMMAAADNFEIMVRGRGTHAAMPQLGADAVLAAAAIVQGLQAIAARNVHPQDAVVVSVTQIHGGEAWNILPEEVVLRGTCRTFRAEVQALAEARIRAIAEATAAAHEATVDVRYLKGYPPTVNSEAETDFAAAVAVDVVGAENVDRAPMPCMGSEDFAYMLEARPGCYVWLGNGPGDGGCLLHSPHYDFNDDALAIGASYWVRLAETALAKPA